MKDHENEIVAIPRLLELLDLSGSLVSIDSIGQVGSGSRFTHVPKCPISEVGTATFIIFLLGLGPLGIGGRRNTIG